MWLLTHLKNYDIINIRKLLYYRGTCRTRNSKRSCRSGGRTSTGCRSGAATSSSAARACSSRRQREPPPPAQWATLRHSLLWQARPGPSWRVIHVDSMRERLPYTQSYIEWLAYFGISQSRWVYWFKKGMCMDFVFDSYEHWRDWFRIISLNRVRYVSSNRAE